jgi:5-methyltetrahydropteroyltriglutamate--homocysteine methyltransferase
VHLCFGNYGGQTIQKGFFRELLPFFNGLACDHLVLEFARRGYDELEVFRDLKPSIALGVGVIDIKDNETETPTEIARRIERAVKVLGAQRISGCIRTVGSGWCSVLWQTAKCELLVEGRNLYCGSLS